PAHHHLRPISQDPLDRRTHVSDHPVRIQDVDDVRRVLDQRPETELSFLQRRLRRAPTPQLPVRYPEQEYGASGDERPALYRLKRKRAQSGLRVEAAHDPIRKGDPENAENHVEKRDPNRAALRRWTAQ